MECRVQLRFVLWATLMNIVPGKYIWHAEDGDRPVVVESYLGEQDGRHYVRIEGSTTGIPFDECEMEQREVTKSRRPFRKRIF